MSVMDALLNGLSCGEVEIVDLTVPLSAETASRRSTSIEAVGTFTAQAPVKPESLSALATLSADHAKGFRPSNESVMSTPFKSTRASTSSFATSPGPAEEDPS